MTLGARADEAQDDRKETVERDEEVAPHAPPEEEDGRTERDDEGETRGRVELSRVNARGERLTVIEQNGPPANRINILLTADCYSEKMDEDGLYRQHCLRLLNNIFSCRPLKNYRGFFNIYSLYTKSPAIMPERRGGVGAKPTRYDARQSSMDDLSVSLGRVEDTAQEFMDAEVIFVLVNNASGTAIAPGDPVIVLGVQDALAHGAYVLGSWAGLGPEWHDSESVKDHPGTLVSEPPYPNLTIETDPAKVKWSYWFPDVQKVRINSTLPVGLWEGGYYRRDGVYRPSQGCRMRRSLRDFCPVCAEVIALKILDKVRLIDAVRPDTADVVEVDRKGVTFAVKPVTSPGVGLISRWLLDGVEIPRSGNKAEITLNNRKFPPGDHELTLEARDVTGFVRRDPERVCDASHTWRVHITERATSRRPSRTRGADAGDKRDEPETPDKETSDKP